ncbi:MAG: rRNA maturation RNase YbeY [Candidatus Taylorbacteria bacterium]
MLKKFKKIKEAALGKSYALSFSFTTPEKMRKLNLIYRDKNKATDILSFPLSKNEGEIYISRSEAKKEAKKFARTPENFLEFLFLHGCVHLKGYDHGTKMERMESSLRKKLGV